MGIEFNPSERSTLGVEIELQIVDRESRELTSAASSILAELGEGHPDGSHPKAKHELLECTVEVITGICQTVAEAKDDLQRTLKEVADAADSRGLALLCAGSHPFSPWHRQELSPNPRYAVLVEEFQWVARRLQIFGVHYHVGVRSADKAIAIANALRTYVPHLLALSASSPYWGGRDTGMASSRSPVFENLPTAGLPYVFSGWEEFEEFMATLLSAGAITSIREVWWDIRPHPDFGTVELRICDGIPTLREVSALAALAQCLVEWLDTRLDEGDRLPVPRQWVVRQNKWRAARHGLDARLITDGPSRPGEPAATATQVPLRQAVQELVEELRPVGRRLGCVQELQQVLEILDHDPSYARQRAVLAGGGSLVDVVDTLVAELVADEPASRR
ncbi:MAG: glutamate--cysteine ligase [Actinomycetota bacterium]|nr:glutamate--cysteine ligase [Actinomycetota bacterium]